MPLPSNVTLSLQGHSKPGDALPSKPKQGMIVRMSAETLDALEAFPNQPPMEFAFGSNPGIWIGQTFFPMRPLKEQSPHELYLRSSSAAKPMAPLKLYANVTGKFTVERELGEKVQEQVRDRTQVAEKQRTERKVQMLDAPLDIPRVNNKKRKPLPSSSSSLLKKAAHNEHMRNVSSATGSASVSARVASPLQPPPPAPPAAQSSSVRRRMVQYLAVSARLTDEVVRALGGAECDSSTKKTLLALLEEVAEPDFALKKDDKAPRRWRLKTRTWLEVRPYEWKLTEPERTAMARSARLAFKDLKIPESDPSWDFVRYRSTTAMPSQHLSPSAGASSSRRGSPSVSSSSAAVAAAKSEAKRGVISKDVKEKKPKPKAPGTKIKAEVQMKDESVKMPKAIGGKGKEAEERSASKSTSVPTKRSSAPTKAPSHDSGSASSAETPLRKRSTPGESRLTPRDSTSSASTSAKPSPGVPAQASHERKSSVASTMRISKKPPASEKVKDPAGVRETPTSVGVKRKKPSREDDDHDDVVNKTALQKKRRTQEGSLAAAGTPPLQAARVRDLSLPKKPSTDLAPSPRPKVASTPSPMPSARPLQPSQSTSTVISTSSSRLLPTFDKDRIPKTNGASKPRRRSPIYTSSEDEGEIPQHRRRDLGPGLPHFMYNPRPRPPLPPASDHVALRKRYKSSYQEYITVFSFIVTQKSQIEAMLKSDSEADSGVELLETKEIAKLASEHQSLKDELESIKSIFLTGKLPGEASPRSD